MPKCLNTFKDLGFVEKLIQMLDFKLCWFRFGSSSVCDMCVKGTEEQRFERTRVRVSYHTMNETRLFHFHTMLKLHRNPASSWYGFIATFSCFSIQFQWYSFYSWSAVSKTAEAVAVDWLNPSAGEALLWEDDADRWVHWETRGGTDGAGSGTMRNCPLSQDSRQGRAGEPAMHLGPWLIC